MLTPLIPVTPELLTTLRAAYARRRGPGGLRAVAERTDGLVSHQTVVQVLKGNRHRVRESTLHSICAALGVPPPNRPPAPAQPPADLQRRWAALLQDAFDAGRAYEAVRREQP